MSERGEEEEEEEEVEGGKTNAENGWRKQERTEDYPNVGEIQKRRNVSRCLVPRWPEPHVFLVRVSSWRGGGGGGGGGDGGGGGEVEQRGGM